MLQTSSYSSSRVNVVSKNNNIFLSHFPPRNLFPPMSSMPPFSNFLPCNLFSRIFPLPPSSWLPPQRLLPTISSTSLSQFDLLSFSSHSSSTGLYSFLFLHPVVSGLFRLNSAQYKKIYYYRIIQQIIKL